MRWFQAFLIALLLTSPRVSLANAPKIPDQEVTISSLSFGHVPVVRPPYIMRPQEHMEPVVVEPEPTVKSSSTGERKNPVPEVPKFLELDLSKFVALVAERNNNLIAQRLEWLVSDESLKNTKSFLEVQFVGTAQHEENKSRNTVQQVLQRSNVGQFNEFNDRYSGAFEGSLLTGGSWRTVYQLDELNNNLQPLSQANGIDSFNEFRTFIGATLSQPLLRNRGSKATSARIHVAERDRDIAFQTYRREMMRVLADAIAAYQQLVAAQERLVIRERSVEIVKELLASNRDRVAYGLIAESEILETEAGLSQRQSDAEETRQQVRDAMAQVRNYLSVNPDVYNGTKLSTTDKLSVSDIDLDLNVSLLRATSQAPEYLAAKTRAEREGIRVAYAKNQLWPQLDLRGSFGLNGLDTSPARSAEDAFQSDNQAWNVLMEFRLPLDGGVGSRSELKAAKLRKKRSLHQIKAIEVELANSVFTAIRNVEGARYRIDRHREVAAKSKTLLESELQNLELGLSTIRLVLQREQDLNRSQQLEIEALLVHKRALLNLELTRGTLLETHGVEVSSQIPREITQQPRKSASRKLW